MAVIDDLVSSGFSLPQAQAVLDDSVSQGQAFRDELVAAGFTYTQAVEIDLYFTGTVGTLATTSDLTTQGLWAGTQVPAIVEA
jgi:hypothetical protein